MSDKVISYGYDVEIRGEAVWIYQEEDGVVFAAHQIRELIACLANAAAKIESKKAAQTAAGGAP